MKEKIGLILGVGLFLLTLLVPFTEPMIQRCLAILVLAAVFWITEALPLYITSLLIAFLLPVLGVVNRDAALQPFFSPVIALLLGGFLLARAVEKYGLDRRIAFNVITKIGDEPKFVILGIMVCTAVLSGIMSNSASAALMLPVGLSVLKHLKESPGGKYGIAMMLGIAYSANIGGSFTLVGTPPNLIAVDGLARIGTEISFLRWSMITIPFSVLMLFIAWFVLIKLYPAGSSISYRYLKECRKSLEDLGGLSIKEKKVMGVFAVALILWLTESIHGVHYGIVALLAAILLYAFRLLDDEDMRRINWGVLLLVGGGLSLGAALSSTGSAKFLVDIIFSFFSTFSYWLIAVITSGTTLLLTNIASNTATTSLLVPLVIPLAEGLGISARGLALIVGITASFTFILPVGTPPNAIVYGSGYLKIGEMIKTGVILTLITIPMILLFAMTYWRVV